MIPKNDEAGATAGTAATGQEECLVGIQASSTPRHDPASTISTLAELFAVFVADHRQPHRPLKVGIHRDLVERGLLQEDECHAVFRTYAGRRKYQQALVAGGSRYDLDCNPAGEVTADEQEFARAKLAKIKAKMRASAKAKALPQTKPKQTEPRRLGLADPKAAAAGRQADTGSSAGGAVDAAQVVGGK